MSCNRSTFDIDSIWLLLNVSKHIYHNIVYPEYAWMLFRIEYIHILNVHQNFLTTKVLWNGSATNLLDIKSLLESVQDLLIKCMHLSSENKHFFTKSFHRQTCQNYVQPPWTSQNWYFQNHFSLLKIGQIFPKKISMKNICLGDKLLSRNGIENFDYTILYFLKLCPIFVGSVHNFGKSDNNNKI